MDEFTQTELILLRAAIRQKDGIFIGAITSKYGISIRDAAQAFRSLRKRGFLKEQESNLVLTTDGRSWVMENQNQFSFSGIKSWREVPEEFRSTKIKPYQPYAPKVWKLSTKKFDVGNLEGE